MGIHEGDDAVIRCFCDKTAMSPVMEKMVEAICREHDVAIVPIDSSDYQGRFDIHDGDRIILAFDIMGPFPPVWVQSMVDMARESTKGLTTEGCPVADTMGAMNVPRMRDVVMGLMIAAEDDLHTKSVARTLVEAFNSCGVSFPGHCLVEATGELRNLSKWVKNLGKSEPEILDHLCGRLGTRVSGGIPPISGNRLLVVHASDVRTSNTLAFWKQVTQYLPEDIRSDMKVLDLYGKEINECRGCSFEACCAFGRQKTCFHKDHITESAYGAIAEADVILWLCPNYNDNLSAPLVALINRLTVLYRQMSFTDKCIMSVVVSGNSGGDTVQKQVIGSLNMNKGFALPACAASHMTANAPLSILEDEAMDSKAREFAMRIRQVMGRC